MTDILVQQSARHSVYTQRYAGYLANLFDPYLDDLIKEFRVIMSSAPDTSQDLREINRIIREYRKASLIVYGKYNEDALLNELEGFAVNEGEFSKDGLQAAIKNTSVTAVRPTDNQLWAAVRATPLTFPDSNGVKLLEPFIRDWESAQIDKVGNIIRAGYITGKSNYQIVQDVAGKSGYLRNQTSDSIKAMVRTSTNHISNTARQKTYADNDDIVTGYEWVSVLDMRTSSICRSLDGNTYKYDDPSAPVPPAHPNCRSTTAPILDGRFNIDDSVATMAAKGVSGKEQVVAATTYYSWLKEQGAQGSKGRAFVQDVLGKERGLLFLDGGLSADQFKKLTIDELFQPIPLSELRKKRSLQLAFDRID